MQREIDDLTAQRDAAAAKVKALMAAEDPAGGVFLHKEIFTAQQEKLRLQAEVDYRTGVLNRFKCGMN